jgi:hypothetical protein
MSGLPLAPHWPRLLLYDPVIIVKDDLTMTLSKLRALDVASSPVSLLGTKGS